MIEAPILEKIYVTRYLDENPDLSFLNQDYFNDDPKYPSCTQEENEKYKAEDADRLRRYEAGYWYSLGVGAKAYINTPLGNMVVQAELDTGVTFGIASDDSEGIDMYYEEKSQEIISQCLDNKIRISPYLEIIINEDLVQ